MTSSTAVGQKVFTDAPFRMTPQDLNLWYVRNAQGRWYRSPRLHLTEWGFGSHVWSVINGVPAMQIVGSRTGPQYR
ncbi:hypothetical protein PCI56_03345 [Plesiomonas shigelloides subsp. oncorhynchi]|nr:hypothetical protein [Plesiomonas shigelloides]